MIRGITPEGIIKYYNTTEERFWDKVDIKGEDECWPWKAKTRSGYGRYFYPDRYHEESAHRLSWIFTNGDIPNGLWVLHSCDNRLCVNPNHLHLGDHSDNMGECIERNQHNTPYKLSLETRRIIRDTYNKGGVTQIELAKQYGVTKITISRCIHGRKDNLRKDYV